MPKLGWEVAGGCGRKVALEGECHQRQDSGDVGNIGLMRGRNEE